MRSLDSMLDSESIVRIRDIEHIGIIWKEIDKMQELLKKLRWKWHRDITEVSIGAVLEKLERITPPRESMDDFIFKTELTKVYNLMADRESQKLLWVRAHYTRDRNLGPLFQFLFESERDGNPVDCISILKDKKNGSKSPLIMFGNSEFAKQVVDSCLNIGIRFDYICIEDDLSMFARGIQETRRVWTGTSYRGIPIISEKDLLTNHQDAEVIVGNYRFGLAKNYLKQKGFPAEHLWLRQSEWTKQYFDEDIMKPHEHEVFIDGGVYDFQSSLDFIDWCGGCYDAIYAFEADSHGYQASLNRMKTEPKLDAERVHLLRAALWKKNDTLKFAEGLGASSRVGDWDKTVEVDAMSIDSVLNGAPVSFIKLDIEGSELSALQGAETSIKKYKPRLAICVYHKLDDIIEIPLYIHSLVPEYKMYLRHYSTWHCETVLYCVV